MSLRYVALVLVLLISGTLGILVLTKGHDWGDDFAAYMMQARSIAEGTEQAFIRHNTITIEKSSYPFGPICAPWGYPMLLAPVWHFFGFNLIAMKLVNVFFFSGFLICFFLLLTRRLTFVDAVAAVCLVAFNSAFLSFHNSILSDIPFLFFSTLSILLVDRLIVLPRKAAPSLPAGILLGVSIFAASSIRLNGFLLLPVLFMCQVAASRRGGNGGIDGRRTVAVALIPYIAFFSLLALMWLLLPGAQLRSASGGEFDIRYVRFNLSYYAQLLSSFFADVPVHQLPYWFLLACCLVGILRRFRQDYHFAAYWALTLIPYLLFRYVQGVRYIFPLIPFFVYFAFQGIELTPGLVPRLNPRLWKGLAYVLLAYCVVFFMVSSVQLARSNLRDSRDVAGPFGPASAEMFNFVRTRTGADDMVVFFKPRLMRMLTDRDSIMVNQSSDLSRGNYIIVHKRVGDYDQVPLERLTNCNVSANLKPVFENDLFVAFENAAPVR